jgi:DNA N-6-adenine-methyltransferase (Dam)
MRNKGIGGHQSAKMKTEEWLTPPFVLQALDHLNSFDLDPASPAERPWDTAKAHYTKYENGLIRPWYGNVWLNPPYSSKIKVWMKLMAQHNSGIALTFARTETLFFQRYVFDVATSILWLDGRLHFCEPNGVPTKANAGGPSALIAYGEENAERLERSKLKGKHTSVNQPAFIVVGVSPTWKDVIKIVMNRFDTSAALDAIYDAVAQLAPDKVQGNLHYKEKIRQQLQKHFTRVAPGQYTLQFAN